MTCAWPRVVDALAAAAAGACTVPVSNGDMLDQDAHQVFMELGIASGDEGRAGGWTPPTTTSAVVPAARGVRAHRGHHRRAVRRHRPRRRPGCRVRRGDAVAATVRANPSLGVDGVLWVELAAVDVYRGRSPDGAFCELRIAATYEALT